MQSDLGKLFIGGISWDTNEERLKEYFSSYGEILEAVIMKDHTTGRARGFGFIVFSDPVVAERVTKEKHNIDGRMVEAKKAVPRDDQSPISRNSLSIQGSPGPGPGRTRKIFVGGLASTVTETDFKCYFEQYGTITDVVVMYDHSTQRPRGFGFITFDSEEAVEKVLLKTFHELNGKMVEVKRAVPKELSPGPIRSPIGPYPYGLTCASNLFNGRFSPIPSGRNGFAAFGSGYGMGLNFEPGVIGNGYNSIPGYGREMGMGMGMGPYYVGNSGRFGNPVGFENGNGVNTNTSFFSSNNRNLWSNNNGLNYTSNSTGSTGVIGGGILGNTGLNWGPSPISPHGSVNGLVNGSVNGLVNGSTQSGNFGYGGTDGSYGLRGSVYGRNGSNNSVGPTSSFGGSNVGLDGPFSDFYGGNGSDYGGDPSWQEGSGSFGGYGLGDVQSKNSSGYVGGYSVAKRQENRGIAG